VTDPGQPGQPYGDYQPQGGWPPPADPYGPYQQPSYQPPGYEQPGYEQPAYQQPYPPTPYQQPAPYQQPSPYQPPSYQASPYDTPPYSTPAYGAPPKKGIGGLLIGAIAGVVVLVLALCGLGVWVVLRAASNASSAGGTTPAGPPTEITAPGTTTTTPGVTSTDPADAQVGSCLAGDTLDSTTAKPVNDMSIVDCSSSRAKYKVVGIVHSVSKSQFNTDDHVCDAYPTAKSALWQGGTGPGEVLCLAAAH
jgi:hypothetical protein